jgi:hypothetical protein
VKIRRQSALEEVEEPEPEPKERTTTVWKLAEWLGVTEAGVRVFEENERNEQRAASNGQGIVMITACCEEILEVKKRSDSPEFND